LNLLPKSRTGGHEHRVEPGAGLPDIVANTQIWYSAVMAGKNTSITLGDHFADYARRKVETGEYGSTSEVIRDALRLHEERSAFKSKLLEAIDEGLASPIDESFDIDRWYDDAFGKQ
jgi:antitoxin ParD1/3/4